MATTSLNLPYERGLFYGGAWHDADGDARFQVCSPGSGESLGFVSDAGASDMAAAVAAAKNAFPAWRDTKPLERARILREMARIVGEHAEELAMIDAADCGNPCTAMLGDGTIAISQIEYFAGLVLEMKGDSIPMGPQAVNFTVREPLGVVGKIIPFNHPFMFAAGKVAAPLAAGNTVVVKPPEQAPLSALRLAELLGELFPPGVFNVVPGGSEAGAAMVADPGVAMVSLIGSVPTGKAVARSAADTLKPALLELGGKNALVAFADADSARVAAAAAAGMNFAWCGQSCGSTSRLLLHADIHDAALDRLVEIARGIKPGLPTDPGTAMGAIINEAQYRRVLEYIDSANAEGARLVTGGGRPASGVPEAGFYIEPTIFADVTPGMRIAHEEIFGPLLAVMKWSDEAEMIELVNAVDYGLTCSIWTNDITRAHRTAMAVEVGFVWINEVAKHFLGTPFGGVKLSGYGREECLGEMLAYTREKNIHIGLG